MKKIILPPGPEDIHFQNCQFDPELVGGYDNKHPIDTDHLSAGYRNTLSDKAYRSIRGVKLNQDAD